MFLSSLIPQILRRQTSGIPSACFDDCNKVSVEVESKGLQPAICQSDSAFQSYLGNCRTCIDSKSASAQDLRALFQAYLNYCSVVPAIGGTVGGNETFVVQFASFQSALSSLSAASASLASVGLSLGLTSSSAAVNTTTTLPSTVSSTSLIPATTSIILPSTTTFITLPPTTISLPPTPAAPSRPIAKIVGAIIGSVLGIIAVLAMLRYIILRKQGRRRHNEDVVNHEKAMLHSDDFQPHCEELPGDKPTRWNKAAVEVPANETIGAELGVSSGPDVESRGS